MIRQPPRSPLFPSTTLSRSFHRTTPDREAAPCVIWVVHPLPVPFEVTLLFLPHLARPCASSTVWGPSFQLSQEPPQDKMPELDRKSTRLNSSHVRISYADLC